MTAVIDSRDFELNRRKAAALDYLADTAASVRYTRNMGWSVHGAFGIRASDFYPSVLEAVEAAIKRSSETVPDPAPAIRAAKKARRASPDPAAPAVLTAQPGI